MKIYHLNVQDQDDMKYDMHFHYGHPTKTATQLWEDYHTAYSYVIENIDQWVINDVLVRIESMGWQKMEIERVEVEY
jgi:hypothetical protein